MKLSVITPCFNEEERIETYLKVLEKQTVKPEVIIVDGGSTDQTTAIIKQYMRKNKNIKLVKEIGTKKSPGNARNIGWKRAKGDIVYLMDVDSRIEADFTKKVVKEFKKHPRALMIRFNCKPYVPRKFKNPLEKAIFYKDERGDQKLILFSKNIVKKVGYFKAGLGFGEDKEWMKKVMRQKIVDVNTSVTQSKSGYLDFFGMAQRYTWYGRTIPMYLRKTEDQKILFGLILSIALVVLTFTFWIHTALLYLWILAIILPLLRGFLIGAKLLKRFNVWEPFIFLPIVELTAMFFIGIGFFEYIAGNKKTARAIR